MLCKCREEIQNFGGEIAWKTDKVTEG